MKPDFDTILDECIRRIEAGEDLKACLADYPDQATDLEALLSLANEMYTISAPKGSAVAAQVGQERMLKKLDETQAVLFMPPLTWKEQWLATINQISQTLSTIFSKEKLMYHKTLIATVLVLAVLFAGSTMTASAAQGSLPGDTLYSLKTTFEDLSLNTAWDTTAEAERSIQYADRRIQEISELISRSRYEDVPLGVERFEYHLQAAMDALTVVAQNDPKLAQELAAVLVNLVNEQSQLITALLEANPDMEPAALQEALKAALLASVNAASSVTDLSDDNNQNGNDNDHGNENGDDDSGNANNDNGNSNEDNGNDNDDDANDNSDDNSNDNGNDNDDNDGDDNGNDNDDDDDNANDNDDDDDGNENDDDNANDDDDDNANDDDNGNENDDDDDNGNDNGNDNDDDDNDDDNGNDNGNDNDDNDGDDDGNENDDDNGNDNDDDDGDDNGNETGLILFPIPMV